MATHTQQSLPLIAKEESRSLRKFVAKCNNDWVMNFAAGLAFNLITAIVPILIAIVAIAGFTIGNLNPAAEAQLITRLQSIFPGSDTFLHVAFTSLQKSAGLLSILAVLLALFGGSRLFITLEGYFAIIYHVRPRGVLKQNVMAIVMLLIFIILTIPMMLASSIPAVLQSLVSQIPGNGFLFGLLGVVVSVGVSWVLFEAIYIVVPNQHISFRNSWLGAIVAAVLLQIFLFLFPFYITHFLGNYSNKTASTAGFAVIILFFFYYFAVILLVGAEVNAFFAENIRATPDNLPVMVHKLSNHLPANEKDMQEQANPSHKATEPKDIQSKDKGQVSPEHTDGHQAQGRRAKSASTKKASSRRFPIFATLAGTALAFFIQLFQLRRKQ